MNGTATSPLPLPVDETTDHRWIAPALSARGPFRGLGALALSMVLALACAPGDSGEGADAGAGPGETVPPEPLAAAAVDAAVEALSAEGLRGHIAILSADDMEGRVPGSEGDRKARQYMIEQMKAAGLEPGGAGGSWEQPFDIVGLTAEVPTTWTFTGEKGELTLDHWDELIAFSGVQDAAAGVENAELVFVGYGIEAPEYGWNDWKDADVAGKVVLMLNNDPEWDPELFEGERRLWYGRWDYKYQKAAEKGAVAAIIHHTRPSAGYPFGVVQSSWTGPQFELPAVDGEARLQVGAWTTEAATRKLVAAAGHDWDELEASARSADFTAVPLGLTTSIQLTNEVERTQTANVLGLLPGSDPALSQEVVIFGAHHDHLGKGEGEGDVIYNGAVDNASGVSQSLEIARVLGELPRAPRRSMLFAMWGAEEQGLLGSRFYAANPTFAPGRIAANLNIDGGNIWGETEDVVFIGFGKSSLDAVVEKHAGGRQVVGDQFPDRGFFYRSDQFSLAKIGVPAIYLDTGTQFVGQPEEWGREQIEAWESEKYHKPGDELDDTWVWDGMLADLRLLTRAGLDIAEADAMPAWNPGDEFEAARKEAIAAVE